MSLQVYKIYDAHLVCHCVDGHFVKMLIVLIANILLKTNGSALDAADEIQLSLRVRYR